MIITVRRRLLEGAFLAGFMLTMPHVSRAQNNVPHGIGLDGHTQLIATGDTKLVVLIFVASDCPISNRYLPEIQRIRDEFSASPVAFWVVYPNPSETASIVRRQFADFHLQLLPLLDPEQTLTAFAGAHRTPEAAVFSRSAKGDLHEIYRGRIDDRYISFGHEKPAATRHDLENVLRTSLDGRPVPRPIGHPVGCAIVPLATVNASGSVPQR